MFHVVFNGQPLPIMSDHAGVVAHAVAAAHGSAVTTSLIMTIALAFRDMRRGNISERTLSIRGELTITRA